MRRRGCPDNFMTIGSLYFDAAKAIKPSKRGELEITDAIPGTYKVVVTGTSITASSLVARSCQRPV